MSIQRLVVVADLYDLDHIATALVKIGVSPNDIHVSKDRNSQVLESMGVAADMPAGKLYIGAGEKYPVDWTKELGIP